MKINTIGQMAITAVAMLTSASASGISHEKFHAPHHQLVERLAAGTPQGCFSSRGGGYTLAADYQFQSSGYCVGKCYNASFPVAVLYSVQGCACADTLPDLSTSVDAAECSYSCATWPEPCGGPSRYTIWLTGFNNDPGRLVGANDVSNNGTSSVDSSSTTPMGATTITQGGSTVTKSVGPTTTVEAGNGGSGSGSTVGIAVGTVGGVLALAAIIAGTLFFLRRRRQRLNAERSHARAESLNAFVASGATLPGVPPIAAGRPLASDSRLDPRMMVEKRQSAGSVFADNEDYSRKILRVANPDA